MKRITTGIIIILISLSAFISCATSPDSPEAQGTVQGTIQKTIFLLEKQEYERVFNEIVHPDDVLKFTEDGTTIPDMARQFGGEAAEFLYDILIYVKDQKPLYKDDGLIALFDLSNYENDKPSLPELVLEKLNNVWYIRD